MIRTSRYNVYVDRRDGGALVYNSMSNATAILTADELSLVQSFSSGRDVDDRGPLRELMYGGFLVEDTDEIALLRTQYDDLRRDPSSMVVTIAPTLQCNFGCDYCFQGADKPTGKMLPTTQKAVADFIRLAPDRLHRLHITWYGGEPLLALDVIESLSGDLIRICSEREVGYSGFIVTNGYNLTSEVASSLTEWKIATAQITIDGAQDYHDKRRTLLGGQPTFRRILGNIRHVVEETSLQISCRINIDARNAEQVHQLLDEFHAMGLSRQKNFSVYFAPVEAITQGCHTIADACMTKQAYSALETELHRKAYDFGLATLPYPRRFLGLCGAVKDSGYVVVPNGDIHKCWDTVSFPHLRIGSIFASSALGTNPRANEWRSWTPFENPTCSECKLLPVCAGACAHKFINADQTLGEAGSLPCPSWKFQFKERLVLIAIRAGSKPDDFDSKATVTDLTELGPVDPATRLPRHQIRRYRLPLLTEGT